MLTRHRNLCIILFTLLIAAGMALGQSSQKQEVVFGWVIDGPWERNSEISSLFQKEISDLIGREFDVRFPADNQLIGDWSGKTVDSLLDRLLADNDVDIVLAAGVIASQALARRTNLPKPSFAPFVINSTIQHIPNDSGRSGVNNLSYLTTPWNIDRDLEVFQELVPIKHLAFLACGPLLTAEEEIASVCVNAGRDRGIQVDVIRVWFHADSVLGAIEDGVDAVYLSGLMQMPTEELSRLIQGINDRGLPSFALFGRDYVERGVMAGVATPTSFGRIARRMAVYIQRTLLGDNPSTFKVYVPTGRDLVINMATVRAIDVWPPWELITEAELINKQRSDVERELTIHSAVEEALNVNLDYMANLHELNARSKEVAQARSSLLPQIDASITGVVIDKDRASASLGSQAERTVSGSIDATQVIFSEQAWANLSIQKSLQQQREFEREQLRLDIARSASSAYLNVLRTKTFERIQKENLRLTRSNLELARTREQVGLARAAEVLRWESQIATNRKNVIDANSQRNLAEIELNRILNRPLEEAFSTRETSVEDTKLLTDGGRLFEYMKDPGSFRLLRTFMVEAALENSPEMRQFDAAIAAQQRLLTSNKRRFFSPTLALTGSISKRLDESGAGAGSFETPAALQNLGFSFPSANEVDWSLAFNASLPILEGGRRFADVAQARDDLYALTTRRRALADRIEQRMRSALHTAGASYAGIRLSQDAADAAKENLSLVVDAYSVGAVSIIDLIDAQNAALIAAEVAANASYDFLLDLAEVERALGIVYTLMNREAQDAIFEQLAQYMSMHDNDH